MKDKVLAWCREQALFSPGQTVICAVSGGRDSVTMLHVLLSLQTQLGISVEACHFNHRLRGGESVRDEAFVRTLCADWSVPLYSGSGDVAACAEEKGLGIEEAARLLRYDFFASLPHTVATAHTADDQAETVLLNLLRGTGLKGLCGIPPKRDDLVRPILCLTRQEVEEYIRQNALPFVEDSTNAQEICLRNRLRHEVLPLFRQENPNLSETLFRMTRTLREDEAFLQSLADAALQRAALPDGRLCCPLLAAQPVPVRKRAIRQYLSVIRAPKLSASHIDAVDALLTAPCPSARCDLPGAYAAVREYDALTLSPKAEPEGFSALPLRDGLRVFIPEAKLEIAVTHTLCPEKNEKSLFSWYLNRDRIDENSLCVRSRMPGDRLHLPGGEKSLKKLLIDKKIPARQRALLPVIADSAGVIAVCSLGIDPLRTARPGEDSICITIKKEEKERNDQQIRYGAGH